MRARIATAVSLLAAVAVASQLAPQRAADAAAGAPGPATTMLRPPATFAGLRALQTQADVERQLGRGTLVSRGNSRQPGVRVVDATVRYPRWGVTIVYRGTSLAASKLRLSDVATRDPRYHTPGGVKIGAPARLVQRQPGMRCYRSGTTTECQLAATSAHAPTLRYWLRAGRVWVIDLNVPDSAR